jgi:STAM-binding protein
MRVPSQVISQFLSLAQRNTSRRIETLGLLLGTERLQYGRIPQLVVEVLVVPQQTGTSDTCAMLSEEQVLAVSLERGLDCLGWVCPQEAGARDEADVVLLDTYASDAVVFHVLDGLAYTCVVSADATGSHSDRLCSVAEQWVSHFAGGHGAER